MIAVSSAWVHPPIVSSRSAHWLTSTHWLTSAHSTVPVRSAVGIEVTVEVSVSVSAPIFEVDVWSVVEEHIAVVMSVDGEDPAATAPKEWAHEVVGL